MGHRHYSSLHWLYPGLFLPSIGNTEGNLSTVAKNRQKTNPLYKAAQSLLAKKRAAGSDHTAWSAAWAACLSARLGNGNAAWKSLVKILDRYSVPNLLFLHPRLRANEVPTKFQEDEYKPNMRKRSCVSRGLKTLDKSPFQFDGNMGFVAALCEMIVQSHVPGHVDLIPALSDELRGSGRATGLGSRGSTQVSLSWESGKVFVTTLLFISPHPWYSPGVGSSASDSSRIVEGIRESQPGYFEWVGGGVDRARDHPEQLAMVV
eukprot:gene35441-45391_t